MSEELNKLEAKEIEYFDEAAKESVMLMKEDKR